MCTLRKHNLVSHLPTLSLDKNHAVRNQDGEKKAPPLPPPPPHPGGRKRGIPIQRCLRRSSQRRRRRRGPRRPSLLAAVMGIVSAAEGTREGALVGGGGGGSRPLQRRVIDIAGPVASRGEYLPKVAPSHVRHRRRQRGPTTSSWSSWPIPNLAGWGGGGHDARRLPGGNGRPASCRDVR
jgi:hypothetical protein